MAFDLPQKANGGYQTALSQQALARWRGSHTIRGPLVTACIMPILPNHIWRKRGSSPSFKGTVRTRGGCESQEEARGRVGLTVGWGDLAAGMTSPHF